MNSNGYFSFDSLLNFPIFKLVQTLLSNDFVDVKLNDSYSCVPSKNFQHKIIKSKGAWALN